MTSIKVNDVFEEMSEENKRLLKELIFAKKCLKVLITFKSFVDFISNKIKTNLDSNECQIFEDLNKDIDEVLNRRNENLSQNTISSENENISKESKLFEKLLKEVEQTFKEKYSKCYIKEENKSLTKESLPLKINDMIIEEINEFNTDINEDNIEENDDSNDRTEEQTLNQSLNEESESEIHEISNQLSKNNFLTNKTDITQQNATESLNSEEIDDNYESNDRTEEQPIKRRTKRKTFGNIKPDKLKNRVICEYVGCGKDYSNRDHMRLHFRTHFLEKSLKCEVEGCDYLTWERRKFTDHMNAHKGIRPYVCTDCGQSFTTKRHLTAHIKSIHLREEAVCEICDKPFKNR